MQSEILKFIDGCFGFLGSKSFVDLNEFTKINEEHSSEMLLAVSFAPDLKIMTILQNNLPCSGNFFRFQGNYDKFMESKARQSNSPV